MKDENREIGSQQEKLAKLLAGHGHKYTPPTYFKTGGVRNVFRTDWGPDGARECVAKVDRDYVESPRARRHLERGCTTANELQHVAAFRHAGVTQVVDYFGPEETEKVGLSGTVVVEEFVPNAMALDEWVATKGPLNEKQWRQFALSYVSTVSDVVTKGIFHRDHKPSNILLVEDERGDISVKITDWANACRKENAKSSFLPTAGGHLATNPRIMGPFTGEESKYDEKCEVYGVVSTLAFAARGRPIFNYDPDTGKATAWDTGESVLNVEGRLDPEKHGKILRRETKKLPKKLRKYGKLIRDGMTIEEYPHYYSAGHFFQDLEHLASEPMGWKRKAKYGGLIAAALAAVVGLGFGLDYANKAEEKVQKSEEKYNREIKINAIRSFSRAKGERDEIFIEEGEIVGWVGMFQDQRTGLAAYIDPEVTYEAIQATGSEDYETLKKYFYKKGSDTRYGAIPCIIDIEAPGGTTDMICRNFRNLRGAGVKKKWEEAKVKYEEKQQKEAELRNTQINLDQSLNKIHK
jgi:serine/threonine protein kinase